MSFVLDLNELPPHGDNIIDIPICSRNSSLGGSALREELQTLQSHTHPNGIIDLEANDDDVVFSSPRSFYQARSRSKRHAESTCPDLPIPLGYWFPVYQNKRRRFPPQQKEYDISSESSAYNENFYNQPCLMVYQPIELQTSAPPQPQVVEQKQEEASSFTCPICMDKLVTEMTTRCGHVFCEKCIKAAIRAQHKCPTCRKKLTTRSIFRIYLSTNT